MSLRSLLSVGALLAVTAASTAQELPMLGPLVPLNRRTRDLNDPELYVADYYPQAPAPAPAPLELPRYHFQYDDRGVGPADDEYFRADDGLQQYPVEYPTQYNNRALEKTLLDFLEENVPPKDESNEGINKRMLSSFRERMEREKSKEQHEKLAEMFLQKLQEEAEDREMERESDRDYVEMIEDLWDKYKTTHHDKDAPVFVDEVRKRQIPVDYSSLGWSGVGYRKRSPPSDMDMRNNGLYFLKYPPQKDVFEDDGNRLRYNLVKPLQAEYPIQRPDVYRTYNPEYMYAKRKRYPVAKRSSNFYGPTKPVHHKRGVNREQFYKKTAKNDSASGTDPKVVKDLSNIFGNKDFKKQNITDSASKSKKMLDKNGKTVNKKTASTTSVTVSPVKVTTVGVESTHHHNHKEHSTENHKQKEVLNVTPIKDEPLNIQKKSIDWSNYFGIDRRRKKSESFSNDNEIDNEWLIKRYNKAVAMAVKRSSEYPLNFFRSHETKKDNYPPGADDQEEQRTTKPDTKSTDETKLGDMDDKLKNIEDLIIDEALKYTGAHAGETDLKEIQEVKDKVISRLAAAYSLEKMRRALSEFKTSLAAQKYANKADNGKVEEAEDTMKKKSTEAESRCSSKEPCDDEFSTRSGNEIEPERFSDTSNLVPAGSGKCDVLENRCRRLVNGGYSTVFYPICKWHQLCYLCGTDSGSPEELTACDVMFLSRADALCQADVVCQWAARPAVNFLREVHEAAPKELASRCNRNTCEVAASAMNIQRR